MKAIFSGLFLGILVFVFSFVPLWFLGILFIGPPGNESWVPTLAIICGILGGIVWLVVAIKDTQALQKAEEERVIQHEAERAREKAEEAAKVREAQELYEQSINTPKAFNLIGLECLASSDLPLPSFSSAPLVSDSYELLRWKNRESDLYLDSLSASQKQLVKKIFMEQIAQENRERQEEERLRREREKVYERLQEAELTKQLEEEQKEREYQRKPRYQGEPGWVAQKRWEEQNTPLSKWIQGPDAVRKYWDEYWEEHKNSPVDL